MATLEFHCPECEAQMRWETPDKTMSDDFLDQVEQQIDDHLKSGCSQVDVTPIKAPRSTSPLFVWSQISRGFPGVQGKCLQCDESEWFPSSKHGEVLLGEWIRDHIFHTSVPSDSFEEVILHA